MKILFYINTPYCTTKWCCVFHQYCKSVFFLTRLTLAVIWVSICKLVINFFFFITRSHLFCIYAQLCEITLTKNCYDEMQVGGSYMIERNSQTDKRKEKNGMKRTDVTDWQIKDTFCWLAYTDLSNILSLPYSNSKNKKNNKQTNKRITKHSVTRRFFDSNRRFINQTDVKRTTHWKTPKCVHQLKDLLGL